LTRSINQWKIFEFNSGDAKDVREYGRPVKLSFRAAVAMVRQVEWEQRSTQV